MGLDDPCFTIRCHLSILAALRHFPALLDAVAPVGAVGLYAGLDDRMLRRTRGSAAVDLLHALAAAAGLAAVRLRAALDFAGGVEFVLLRLRSGARKKERDD
jgi:hypothetical protein